MNELTMELDVHSRTPLYEQIYNYIKDDIQSGKIKAQEKLPSTRSLSIYLEVSRSTVDMAYGQLLSEGYIEAEPCRGYFVCEIESLAGMENRSESDDLPKFEDLPETGNLRRGIPVEKRSREKLYDFDFSPNGIDLDHFPFNTWRKITKGILQDDKKDMFQLGESRGDLGLRSVISNYLYHSRGVKCQPQQIVIGAGNDYLLMLLSRFLGNAYRIAMENPTYKQAYRMFESLGFAVTTVDMDRNGMQVEKLRKSGADIAYVMPSHQYPLGVVMPMKRRMELLAWANEAENRYIIEDDYDSEFRYVGKPIPALQGYDENGRVIYIGTLSRSIAPAIRVSYMVLPLKLLAAYERAGSFISSTVSRIDQRILEEFIGSGYYERHLNKMRALYKSKHDVLMEELRAFSDVCEASGDRAGVHVLVRFTNGMSEEEILSRAAGVGVKLYGISGYYIRPEDQEAPGMLTAEECRVKMPKKQAAVLMGYANLKEEEIRQAMGRLKEALGVE